MDHTEFKCFKDTCVPRCCNRPFRGLCSDQEVNWRAFNPSFSVTYDLFDDCTVLGYEEEDQDDLFFISDSGKTQKSKKEFNSTKRVKEMMCAVIIQTSIK